MYDDLSLAGEPRRLALVKLTIGRGMSDDGMAIDCVATPPPTLEKPFDKCVAAFGDVSMETIGRETDI